MAPQIIDRCYLTIDGTEVVCESIDTDVDPAEQIVNAMTRDNLPLGRAHGNPKIDLAVVTAMDGSSDGMDFEAMCLSKQEFSATKEYEGGTIKTYVHCAVAKATERARTGAHVSWNLTITSLGVVS